MRKTAALIGIAMLAACSQNGDGNGAAGGNGTGAAGGGTAGATGVTMQPGQWESRIEVAAANMPQLPPGVTAPGTQPMTTRFCLTPEMAANPSADTLGGARNPNAGACRTENYSVANGRITGTTICEMGGVNVRSTMNGQFTPTSYEMTIQSSTQMGGTSTNSEMRITAQRVGDCPAG